MYRLQTSTSKTEKRLRKFAEKFPSLNTKIRRLRKNPRKAIGAHPLQGVFQGLWSAHLSRKPDIVIVYAIYDKEKLILILRVGSHNQVY